MTLKKALILFFLCAIVHSVGVSAITDLVTKFPDNSLQTTTNFFVKELNSLITAIRILLINYPDPRIVENMVMGFIKILIPIYIIAIIINGIYLLFVSISPEGRMRAKSMLLKLILSMILVSMSMDIYDILVGISYGLTYSVAGNAYIQTTLLPQELRIELIIFLIIALFITFHASIVIMIINLMILLMGALFPFTLFFYFFDLTKSIGATLLRYTFMAVFSPVIMALVLMVVTSTLNVYYFQTGYEEIASLLIILAGFILLIFAPLMMLGILQWIGGAIAGIGIYLAMAQPFRGAGLLGAGLTTVGGVAAGMGPGALMAAGASYAFGSAVSTRTRRR
ncbi:MAG: hypothetical protein DRO94_01785 [Candidatus Altiarchaeales archaeon]|nr:MAG: hypothetical protein DRO95_02020 [Candidatus Altiarchaeales archaeon]RLI94916.1 MAG: hypothetical protein DRO94_01785 [Candidatus Altiarchaeales archaeon]HDO82149.1 hypothetical protein [Candidatus Altiarchaeales archaeon]HEX54798.1 hypothetical protein [Candidatus Altiarchaeales archaeon]